MKSRLALLPGFIFGAFSMYFLDPRLGRRRRVLVQDQLVRFSNLFQRRAAAKAKDFAHRIKGRVVETRLRLVEANEEVDDITLVERVRAAVGHVTHHSSSVCVDAKDGVVTLTGMLPEQEIETVVDCAENVRGVRGVNNEMEVGDPMAQQQQAVGG